MVAMLAVTLAASYAGLAVYKAYDYTTTPAQGLIVASPAQLGLAFQDVTIRSAVDNLPLAGWWIPHPSAARAVILVHGRYENRAGRLALARPLWDAGYSVLLIDLRGHGESADAVASYGVREQRDVVGAVNFLVAEGYRGEAIGAIGWSLGGTSALLALAQTPNLAAVVSDSAYANAEPLLARNVLRPGLRLAMRLVRGVDLDEVRPADAIAQAGGRRILIIQGEQDTAVPVEHAALLAHAAQPGAAEIWIVPDAGHTQAYALRPDEYARRVLSFFGATLAMALGDAA